MSAALDDIGGRPPAPALTLAQAAVLAVMLGEARRAQLRVRLPLQHVIVSRPMRAHATTMEQLQKLGLIERRLIEPSRRGNGAMAKRPIERWRLTPAGIAVAESPAPAAEAGSAGA